MAVTFGRFTFDTAARQLLRASDPVHLSPKAFDLLALLIERRPAAVAKGELHARLWPDTFVSEINLAVLVAEIRTALGDSARHPAFIRTVQRFGYAFSAAVVEIGRPDAPPPLAVCWVTWQTQRTLLKPGENVLGRDPSVDICIEAVGVSRRHAMIVVAGEEVILSDLASKNGTFVGDRRLTAPAVLTDGVEIRLGPIPLRFRQASRAASTQTVY